MTKSKYEQSFAKLSLICLSFIVQIVIKKMKLCYGEYLPAMNIHTSDKIFTHSHERLVI